MLSTKEKSAPPGLLGVTPPPELDPSLEETRNISF